jgi:hypothetical protein
MSFLYPLLLAGLAAVALPIVLHMIRRHTRQRVTFSSLMFLRETLPRFQSRSRLEHVPLLLLRCAALCLLAFAFARPFLVRPAATGPARADRRTVLLVDTSASMRRTGVWARAVEEARSVLAGTGPADRVCVMSFDRATQTRIGFEQWAMLEPARRAEIAGQEIARLSPGWAPTHLGHALIAAAEALEEDEVNDGQQAIGTRRIVLVSDLQQGSNLDALLAYEWPRQTELVVKAVPCPGATNASLQLVTSGDRWAPSQANGPPAIRVTNSPDATNDRFQLAWGEGTGTDSTRRTLDVYVPAGQSTVVRLPIEPNRPTTTRLVLTGDDHDFDNVLYLAPRLQQQLNILYVGGDDPNDTEGMLYYVCRAFRTSAASPAHVIRRPGGEPIAAADIESADWIIVADTPNEQNRASLRRGLEAGKPLLFVLESAQAVAALASLAGVENLRAEEADTGRYVMLDRIEFDHPLLKPFSDPRFGDFSRIHFWKHRRIQAGDCPGARVLAWFDDDDPAWLEMSAGKGSLLVWTSGWHPADSDLALSSKFVPLLYSALESAGALAEHPAQYFVGDPVPLPDPTSARTDDLQIRKPDGSIVRPTAGQQTFVQTDVPGIYSVANSARDANPPSTIRNNVTASAARQPQSFAVNLAAGESRTEPMPPEDLEKLGVSLQATAGAVPATAPQTARQDRFEEMESRQKLWRWILLATLLVLLIETWLAGRLTRPAPVPEGEQL